MKRVNIGMGVLQFILLLIFLIFISESGIKAEFTLKRTFSYELKNNYPTGIGWADFDGNGWPDLAVACGLDVNRTNNKVYFNLDGIISQDSVWVSEDMQASGNLYIGDLDKNGWPDLIVASTGTISSGFEDEPHVIYLNDGTLATAPSWRSKPTDGFSCSAGDPDGDGDLDIIFTEGIAAVAKYLTAKIYINDEGVFDTLPGWETDDTHNYNDAAFVDIDNDGDLDLLLIAKTLSLSLFYNNNGMLETTPSFTSSFLGGRQLAVGDVDNDGFIDVAVAVCGFQPMTEGYFCIYKNNSGVLEDLPSWYCGYYKEPSCVEFADMDADGDLDLVAGSWYGPFGIFENNEGTFGSTYDWVYAGGSSQQQVAVRDFDKDGLVATNKSFTADGTLKLFYLEKNIQQISSIELNGIPLGLEAFCYNLLDGWVSLGTAPEAGDELIVYYTYSTDLDLATSCLEAVFIFENEGENHKKPPTDVNILLLVDEDFGANFCMGNSFNILEHFEDYGWQITLAGTKTTLNPCDYSATVGCSQITVDTLISQIDDVTQYDIISIMPGDYYANLNNNVDVNRLLQSADEAGVVISAWCKAPRLLAAADILNGVDMTGNNDYQSEYLAAGANYLGAGILPVVDGNIVTSTRSNYYRTYICETIAKALPPEISNVMQMPETPTTKDSVIVTAKITDSYNSIALAEIHVNYGSGYMTLNMYDDGNHHDGGAGDSVYGGAIPPVHSSEIEYYLYAEDDVTAPAIEPPNAPDSTYHYMIPSCCLGVTGNADCSETEEPDISDITRLIDYLYISHVELCCPEEADTDGSGGEPDISDITKLIDHLYISHSVLPTCQ